MEEQYKCPSYFDDENVLQGCTCGKCSLSTIAKTILESLESQDAFFDGYQYHLTRDKSGFEVGTVTLEDFDEIDEDDEWRQEIKSHLLQSQINLLDVVIEEMKTSYNPYKDEHDPKSNICPCCVYQEALEDQISSLNEVVEELKNN